MSAARECTSKPANCEVQLTPTKRQRKLDNESNTLSAYFCTSRTDAPGKSKNRDDERSWEHSEAAATLASLTAAASAVQQKAEQGDVCVRSPKESKIRRVTFAPGPLTAGPGDRVTEDGHPDHEGEVAVRRREAGFSYCEEPVTKYTMKLLEAELKGTENAPSLERLKRRFGLAPPIRRDLPYVSAANRRHKEARSLSTASIFSHARYTYSREQGPNTQSRLSRGRQVLIQHARLKTTPEGHRRGGSSLLNLLRPLDLIGGSRNSGVAQ